MTQQLKDHGLKNTVRTLHTWTVTGLALFLVMACAGQVDAQDGEIFSGRGVQIFSQDSTNTAAAPKKESRWPKLLDFTNDSKPMEDRQPFLPKIQDGGLWKNPFKRNGESPKLFGSAPNWSAPDWLPKRDPNAPNLFAQMNAKSKNFIDRTTDWAQQKNNNFKAKTFETWDNITRDFRGARGAQPEMSSRYGTQPPVRTADSLQRSADRF